MKLALESKICAHTHLKYVLLKSSFYAIEEKKNTHVGKYCIFYLNIIKLVDSYLFV